MPTQTIETLSSMPEAEPHSTPAIVQIGDRVYELAINDQDPQITQVAESQEQPGLPDHVATAEGVYAAYHDGDELKVEFAKRGDDSLVSLEPGEQIITIDGRPCVFRADESGHGQFLTLPDYLDFSAPNKLWVGLQQYLHDTAERLQVLSDPANIARRITDAATQKALRDLAESDSQRPWDRVETEYASRMY